MNLVHLARVGSTNDHVAEQARLGAPDGLWVRADAQTAGRGRHGRNWIAAPGNLFISTLIRPQPGEGPLPQLSFVAALALDDALRPWVPADRLTIKWPNDLLLDGAKVSGILLEGGGDWVVAGFGVNLQHRPQLDRPTMSLRDAGLDTPAPSLLASALAEAFACRRAVWRAQGFAPVRADWLKRAAGLGASVSVQIGAETVSGCFVDLGHDGSLLLRLANGGIRAIHSGEVFGL